MGYTMHTSYSQTMYSKGTKITVQQKLGYTGSEPGTRVLKPVPGSGY